MLYLALFIIELIFLGFLSGKIKLGVWRTFQKITKSEKATKYFYALVFLPGTFIHEISHFLFALILLVPVGKLELTPLIEDKKLKLGSVSVAKCDIIRSTIIGIAPLIAGVFLIIFSLYQIQSGFVVWTKLFTYLLTFYLIFEVGNTMFLSSGDAKSGVILLCTLLFFYIVLFALGVRVDIRMDTFLGKYLSVFKKADIFLSIPIIIDLVIYFSFKTRFKTP